MSLNRATLIGHVGKDPEVKTLESGVKAGNFTLATTEKGYTLQNGTVVPDRTEWHNIVVWRGLAELAEKWIAKGSQIYVEGKITTRSWEKDSVKFYRTEIVAENIQLLGRKPEAQEQPQQAEQSQGFSQAQKVDMPAPTQTAATFDAPSSETGNDLPF